ncbi:hypothetical protein MNBD_PLANCTO02-1455 [hydrothermal vent metagenome]|uniref:Uncharacterized protein n=1 Tax=hydrothermal vent metagenome TaxID=652676 RepID=A0A3B1E287_9ZZZZ
MVLVLPGFVTILSHNESAVFSSPPFLGRGQFSFYQQGGSKRGMLIQLSFAIELAKTKV